MKRFLLVMLALLLAACGSDDDGDKKSATGEPLTRLSAPQIVGQWMDEDGDVVEFFEDGSISGYSDYNFEAATYTIVNADGETRLLLNTSNGSVYAREFTLTEMKGCDDHAFAFIIEDQNGPQLLWYVGGESFDSVTPSELSAHEWRMDAISGASLRFEDEGRYVAQTSQGEVVGTWSLEGNSLTGSSGESSEAPETETVIRVARCDGKPMVIVFDVGEGYTSFMSDPNVTPQITE
jgi:hypothetical protein